MKKLLIVLLTVAVALGTAALVNAGSSQEGEAELEDPGNNLSSPTGVEAEIEFEDDGSTLKISGEAEGLTPGVPYASLIYDVGSLAEGSDACEPAIFDPDDPNNIIETMFVGFWEVDEDGEGELEATNIVDDVTGAPVYVPLSKIGTISIRDLTVEGPFGPGSGPAAVVACGEVVTEDEDEDEDGSDDQEFRWLAGTGMFEGGFLCGGEPPCPGEATASNGATIEVTGEGTLSVEEDVSGGGSFRIVHGEITRVGIWTAKELVSFVSFGASPCVEGNELEACDDGEEGFIVFDFPTAHAGLAVIEVEGVVDGTGEEFDAILTVGCILPGVPDAGLEGIEFEVLGGLNFNVSAERSTLFIDVGDDDD